MQVRFKAKPNEIAIKLGEAYGVIMGHIIKNGTQPTMMPLARYFAVEGDTLDMAAAMAVAEPLPSEGDIDSDQLPAGLVASTWHTGPYDGLPKSNAALEQWITEHDHEADSQSWEIYVTDPTAESDPGKWRTQVFRRLKK